MHKRIVAIIPARGGSKRIKNKNIIDFCGKPLLAWSIESAKKTRSITDIYVTSDEDSILKIAQIYGAKIIKRPTELSNDFIHADAPVLHAYKQIHTETNYDFIVFLQPTAPLRKIDDIENAIQQIIQENADSLLSVTKSHSFLWKKTKEYFEPINYDYLNRPRSQDIIEFKENGSIYIFKPHIILDNENRLGGNISTYCMEPWQDVDIDTLDDYLLAKYQFQNHLTSLINIPKIDEVELLVYDFDGVMTDNMALISCTSQEMVNVNRSDGLAVSMFNKRGVKQIILSTEQNDIVKTRADKLKIECLHGIGDKAYTLKKYLIDNNIDNKKVVYTGNDTNDLEVMKIVGFTIAPFDAHPKIKSIANYVTKSAGGQGVIREIYDLLSADLQL